MNETTFVEGFHDGKLVKLMTYRELGKTGLRVSSLGIGCSPLPSVLYESITEEEAIKMVRQGVRAGMNYLDTAPWYGNGRSEQILGKALKEVPRKAYYIATKVGRYELDILKMFDFSAQKTIESVDKSLRLLGLDYVDVIQVHDIEFAENIDQVLTETLPTLSRIVSQGKARFIGITSYSLELLKFVLDNSTVKIDLVLSYARNNFLDDGLVNFIPYFQSKGVGIINASLTSCGLLSSVGPQKWHDADDALNDAASKARHICMIKGVEPAHLAIKSALETEGVSTHLLGCTSHQMLSESAMVASQPINGEEKQIIAELEDRCFKHLVQRSWGNRGPEKYFEKLFELRQKEKN